MPTNHAPQASSPTFPRIDSIARSIQQNIFRSNPLPHLILQQSKKIFLAMGPPLLLSSRHKATTHMYSFWRSAISIQISAKGNVQAWMISPSKI
jgi:hypothetical protein